MFVIEMTCGQGVVEVHTGMCGLAKSSAYHTSDDARTREKDRHAGSSEREGCPATTAMGCFLASSCLFVVEELAGMSEM